jgi:hypothetical protein
VQVSATAADAARNNAVRLGLQSGQVVQEIGWDADADEALRTGIVAVIGGEMVDEDSDEVVDAVLMWWRADDGDLVDALMDALGPLADGGVVWLLTPKVGRPGHVEASEIAEAAPTAGLALTSSAVVSPAWSAARLAARKSSRGRK